MLLGCEEAPRYGYELGAWLAGEGLVAGPVSAGRLYETLASLARQGSLAVSDEPGERGPARRRYELTEAGKARLLRWEQSLERSAAVLARLLARAAAGSRPPTSHREGGEAMPCQCHCGGPEARSSEPAQSAPAQSAPAAARSVEERLEVIEGLLQHLSTR